MNIAIDYDGTFNTDEKLWETFIKIAQWKGHNIYCVTMRKKYTRDMENIFRLIGPQNVIFATTSKLKHKLVQDKNIRIDIWIDDEPYLI